jgi:hypothetical protein
MSLDFRKDTRSVQEFAEDIAQFTQKEHFWGLALRLDFCERGMPCEIEEHGVDNSGELILGHLPNYNVDKIYNFLDGTKQHIEIKTIPERTKGFFTFKLTSISACIKQKAHILVPRSWAYYLIPPETCSILLRYPSKIHERFAPGKPAVRIYESDINEFIRQKKILKNQWKHKADKFIKENSKIMLS